MKKWPWFLLVGMVIFFDQASKYFVTTTLMPYHPLAIFPGLNITLAFNTGAAFSFLSDAGDWHRWFFAAFSTIVSIALVVWILRTPKSAQLQLSAISLILGGALGNLLDRAFSGYVIDFIQVYYKSYYWPIFNLADSAICIGAALLLIDLCKNTAR
ncbi:lipoprotein signal peptidase [Legionella israelensis]|uniref:Lipoprotein signal peptidase n=1 Tax=Legionella israelensis TaxID=454 RepID=A0A0W0VUL1_9GAMM|nr:signal peptidase II [Legionella israelensis]KTD23714.1 lipoprotein signal peptidase [Legionella israelensis]QBR84021.1 lipoprotein signal peptidase [Legionella israelensis]QBS10906.1 lipoprotein signal peptidase [Legionella israelensis]SCX80130.1 signal peptidase II [Legionella israelensis DSM 19235]STX57894.1 signal peptidase II [Legionella israelensis]